MDREKDLETSIETTHAETSAEGNSVGKDFVGPKLSPAMLQGMKQAAALANNPQIIEAAKKAAALVNNPQIIELAKLAATIDRVNIGNRIKDLAAIPSFRNIAAGLASSNNALQEIRQTSLFQNEEPRGASTKTDAVSNIPKPPAFETNRRLANIENHISQLLKISVQEAEVTNSLQVTAAELLNNFNEAAGKSDKTSARAILVGVCAVLITVLQIAYTEFWKEPRDRLAILSIVSDVKQIQTDAADKIVKAAGASDSEIALVLRDLKRALEQKADAPPEW